MMELIQQNPLRIRKLLDHGSRQRILFIIAVLIMAGAVQTLNGGSLGVAAYNENQFTSNYQQYGSNERTRRKLTKGQRRNRRRLNGESGGYKILKAFQTVWSETTFVSATGVETSCIKPVSYVAGTSGVGKGKKKGVGKGKASSSVDDSSNDNLENESSVSKTSSTSVSSTDSTTASVETKSDTISSTEDSTVKASSTDTSGDKNTPVINTQNASDIVTLDEITTVTLNGTKSTGNRRHLVYLSEQHTTMVHRTLQNSSDDSKWATIVGDILDRNGTETQSATPAVAPFTVAPVATPFTAAPLETPFTVAPLASPITVSPVSQAPITAAPVFAEVRTATSSAPIPIATLAPAAAITEVAALDPTAPLEPKVKSPKGPKADPAALVGAKVKAPDKKKDKTKSKKKLPYCDEIDGSVNVPDNIGSQDGDVVSNDDTAAVEDDTYYDDTVDKETDTSTETSTDNGGKGDGTTGSSSGDHVTGNTSENHGTDGNAVTDPTPSTSTGDDSSTSDSPSGSPSLVPSDLPQFNSGAPPAQESVCEDFFNGSPVPSDTKRDTFVINVGVLVEKGTNQTETIASLLQDLNKEIAPALLGCSSTSRRRQLLLLPEQVILTASFTQQRPRLRRLEETDENPVTEFININFHSPTKSKNGTVCADTTSSNQPCIPLNVTCDVSYYGDKPKDFSDILRRAILFWDWNDIPGWKGFSSIQLKQSSNSNGTDGSGTDNDKGNGGDTSGGSGANGIREVDQNSDNDGVNPGAFVAAGVAALTLLLIALFVHQRRTRERVEEDNEMKHIQLTDDEDDERLISHETFYEKPYGKSYVLSDEDEIDNENDGITSLPGMRNNVYSGSRDEDEEGTEVMAAHQDPSIQMSYHPPIDSPSLDESSYYKYPSRHVITHRINSYDSSKYKASITGSKNSRSYKIPDDTVDL